MNIPPIPPIQLTDADREAAQQAVRQIANRLTAAAQELADAFAGTTKALRPLAAEIERFNRRVRVSRMHRLYAAKRRNRAAKKGR